jgi:hypothetical protein
MVAVQEQVATRLLSVTGCMNHFDANTTHLIFLAILCNTHFKSICLSFGTHHYLTTLKFILQLEVSGNKVRMEMGQEDIFEFSLSFLQNLNVLVNFIDRVDDDGFALRLNVVGIY